MSNEYRHEEKYLLRYGEYLYLKRLLGAVLKKDLHTGETGSYTVTSLYFDTWRNRCFEEKQMGIMQRYKIRMRVYSANSPKVNLEIKNKSGKGIYKESVQLDAEDAKKLINGNTEVLLKYHGEVAQKAYRLIVAEGFHPSVLVDYEREAYVLPAYKTRITFDSNIRASKNIDGFNEASPIYSRVSGDRSIVLEIKFSERLPLFIKKILSSGQALGSPVSKYCLARRTVT